MSGFERFRSISDFATAMADGPDVTTALYLSAGHDTKPLTFLGPAFLAHCGIDMPAPDVYLYVDHTEPRDVEDAGLSFQDEHTRIRSTDVREAMLSLYPVWLMSVSVESDDGERDIAVARIRTLDQLAFGLCGGWSPDVFIGVRDRDVRQAGANLVVRELAASVRLGDAGLGHAAPLVGGRSLPSASPWVASGRDGALF